MTIPVEFEDPLSGYVISRLGRGVAIEEPLEHMSCVTAYLSTKDIEDGVLDEIYDLISWLQKLNPWLSKCELHQNIIETQDWGENWKRGFKPLHIGKKFVIRPSWESYEAGEDELIIEIDPGQAFGTGTHQTTAMVLETMEDVWGEMARQARSQGEMCPKVLDIGTGTGVLGIGAALLGARPVLCLDIDPVAAETARVNVQKNKLIDKVTVETTSISDIQGEFDIIVANLDKNTLTRLSEAITKRLTPMGRLIISGVLAWQKDEVARAFERCGLKVVSLTTDRKENEWVCIGLSFIER